VVLPIRAKKMTPGFILSTLKCNNMTPQALKLHLQSIKLKKSFYSLNFCYFAYAMMSRFAKFQGFFSSTILIYGLKRYYTSNIFIFCRKHVRLIFFMKVHLKVTWATRSNSRSKSRSKGHHSLRHFYVKNKGRFGILVEFQKYLFQQFWPIGYWVMVIWIMAAMPILA
jgi:hypothetical protein